MKNSATGRPNILFLITDEQRFDHLGAVNPVVKTPNLDGLAADGVLFRRAYTSNPSCIPARAAIMTGKYPHQVSCPTYITHLPEHETCFTTLLQQAGYHTAYIGKLHFATSKVERGFDYQDIVDCHGPCPQGSDLNSYDQWLVEKGFKHTSEMADRSVGPRMYTEWKVDPKYHVDEYVGNRGSEWIEDHAPADRSWFCCISFPGPHSPVDCGNFPEADLYDPSTLDMPETTFEMLREKPPHNSLAHGDPPPRYEPLPDDDIRMLRRAYYANVTLIDRKVGELVDALKARQFYENTLIVFISDHGDYMGDFGLAGKGQNIPEVLMRIPFVVKPPQGGAAGKHESSLVSSVDIAATCLTAAGADIPPDMVSRDLSAYWQNSDDLDDRKQLYMEAGGIRCIRDRQWKFCHYRDRDYGELYDLKNDPWEKRNLWDDPAQAKRKAAMRQKLVDTLIALSPRADIPWNKGAPPL